MVTLTDAQFSYMAGFFDARGSISITKTQSSANRTPSYVLRVIFSANGVQGLTTLTDFMETSDLGSLNHYTTKYGNLQHEWRLVSRDAGSILVGMLPYLHKKQDQARIALRFVDVLNESHHEGRGYLVPAEIVEKKEVCYLALRIVKRMVGDPLSPEFLLTRVSSELNHILVDNDLALSG